jgi:hypothetical protein
VGQAGSHADIAGGRSRHTDSRAGASAVLSLLIAVLHRVFTGARRAVASSHVTGRRASSRRRGATSHVTRRRAGTRGRVATSEVIVQCTVIPADVTIICVAIIALLRAGRVSLHNLITAPLQNAGWCATVI